MSGKTGISLNWGGFKEKVEQATSGISNTQQLMIEIGMAMKGQTVRRFHSGTDPEGNAWKPSQKMSGKQASTKRDSKGRYLKGSGKKSGRGTGQTLIALGTLRNSISFSATALEVHVGSNLPYARIHQLGGMAGRGRKVKIPARPYLGLSKDDQEEIAALVKEHMEGVFK